jgi:uncharacterized membrane protein
MSKPSNARHERNRLEARSRGRSRGSVLVNTLIALSLIVITLIGTELGYLFFLKREFQKTADLAALAAAQALKPGSCTEATAAAIANAAQNLPTGFTLSASDVTCGRWDPSTRPAQPHFGPLTGSEKYNAVRVTIARTPPLLFSSIPGNQARPISVEALAAQRHPMASLTIRSTLLTVDPTQASLLNAVFGGLLGGSLSLDVAGWRGLVNTNIKLLGFLDQLGIDLGIGAGKYDQVLGTDVRVGVLIQAMINALQKSGATATAAIQALGLIQAAAEISPTVVKLGDLLGVQTGSDAAGLNLDLQLFQLLQGVVQVANGKNALVASVPLTVPGALSVTANIRVIEPPQISAVGDPTLAKLDPTGPNQIYVRTAQIRTLISVELPALNGVSNLLNAVTTLVSPVTTLLNNLLSFKLNLLDDVLGCLIACTKDVTDVDILPAPIRLDINLDAGGGESRVNNFSCPADAKTLSAQTTTAAAQLRIGKMGTSTADAKSKVFASNAPPTVAPVPVIDIGSLQCTRLLLGLIPVECDEAHRKAFYGGGLGLKADVPVAKSGASQTFVNPPDLADMEQETPFLPVSSQNIINSLTSTLGGLNMLSVITPTGSPNGGLQNVLTALTNTLGTVIGALQDIVKGVLSPLLDPLVNTLIRDVLGANLAQTEVGGRLTCDGSAELVY